MSDERYFDLPGAVEFLLSLGIKTTPSAVRKIFAEVPHIRIGRKYFISRESLDSWLNRKRKVTR